MIRRETFAFCVLTAGFVAGCSRSSRVPTERDGCLSSGESASFFIAGARVSGIFSSFDGFGCNSLTNRRGGVSVHLKPKAAVAPDETHSGLVLGPATVGNVEASCGVQTVCQLRVGTPPNPHEVGWLVWNYHDNDHFYYLVAKPNGWELGKRDPTFAGGQRFLDTGTSESFPIGIRHELHISQTGPRIEATIDGHHVSTYDDTDTPYTQGKLGFYCEDAEVFFDSPSITSRP